MSDMKLRRVRWVRGDMLVEYPDALWRLWDAIQVVLHEHQISDKVDAVLERALDESYADMEKTLRGEKPAKTRRHQVEGQLELTCIR